MAEAVTSTRRGFLDFSPVKRDDANKENDAPVLSLIQFSKAPFVTFGTVKLGTSRSAVLRVENPTEDVEAEVTVEKIPSSKGFSVDHNAFTIQVMFLSFAPVQKIHMHMDHVNCCVPLLHPFKDCSNLSTCCLVLCVCSPRAPST